MSKSNEVDAVVIDVVMAGLILKTAFAPVENPVSSVKLPAKSADVLDESAVKLSDLYTPFVTVAAFPPIFNPTTGVGEVTANGGIPEAIVDISCVPVIVSAELIFFPTPIPPVTINAPVIDDDESVFNFILPSSVIVIPFFTIKSTDAIIIFPFLYNR